MIPGGHGHHGQTLNDRLTAARYALAGQGLARVVCKATTEEMIAPKKKHIDYLLQCTHEPNVSIPQMANLLIERTQHSSWIVVFKALITVHHLMCYGNERFTQYLASSNFNFQLNNYLDKNAPKGYDMSIFIRRYARYINAKALSYRTVAFDFTKCKRGDEGQLRQMGIEKLLKTVPVLQNQIDALLEFDCNADDLNNGVINAAFLLLFKDLIRLFACYNDANITCLEKYFELTNKKLARETLELYKKFLIRMNKVGEFLKVAEVVGIDRGEIPDLTKAPSSLLEAMEQHLAAMEGRKPGTTSDKPPSDEVVAKKAIEEEEKFLNKLKNETESSEKHLQEKKVNNPFLAAKTESSKDQQETAANKNQKNDMIDLLLDDKGQPKQQNKNNDPFSLETNVSGAAAAANNPFADILSTLSINTGGGTATSSSGGGGGGGQSPGQPGRKTPTNQSEFATSDGFAAAFGSSSNSNIGPGKSQLEGFDAFGDVLQPQNVSNMSTSSPVDLANNNSFVPICSSNSATIINNNLSSGLSSGMATTMLQPQSSSSAAAAAANSAGAGGIVKGDLEATLASLAENLDINSLKGNYKRGQQFNPNLKGAMKTGGPGTPNTAATNGTTSNIGVLGLGVGGGGSISPSSMMMRSPITMPTVGQSMVGGVAAAAGGNGWNTMNIMGHNNWSTTANPTILNNVVGMQPIMPMIGPMSGQQPMMRHPSTLAGSVPILPPNVNASTLSTILSGKSLNNNNNNNNTNSSNKATNNSSTTTTITANNNSQSIDPFGAL